MRQIILFAAVFFTLEMVVGASKRRIIEDEEARAERVKEIRRMEQEVRLRDEKEQLEKLERQMDGIPEDEEAAVTKKPRVKRGSPHPLPTENYRYYVHRRNTF